MNAFNTSGSKTFAEDEKSLLEDFPYIQAELTASRSFSRTDNRMLYSCNGANETFSLDTFQNAQNFCKNAIRSFLNEAGIDFIQSKPSRYQLWYRFYNSKIFT